MKQKQLKSLLADIALAEMLNEPLTISVGIWERESLTHGDIYRFAIYNKKQRLFVANTEVKAVYNALIEDYLGVGYQRIPYGDAIRLIKSAWKTRFYPERRRKQG